MPLSVIVEIKVVREIVIVLGWRVVHISVGVVAAVASALLVAATCVEVGDDSVLIVRML